jgi:hypothetical protein
VIFISCARVGCSASSRLALPGRFSAQGGK